MPIKRALLFGAGGHGKVVMDALLALGYDAEAILLVDDNRALHGHSFLGTVVQSPSAEAQRWSGPFHVAIGDAEIRASVTEAMLTAGGHALTVVHPAAVVSSFAKLQKGCFVAAGAIIGPAVTLGEGVIVNHAAVVDHDCEVGNYVHIGPNATIGGGSHIGAKTLIGAGATVLPALTIGECAIVGAGAVVVNAVGSTETHIGVPAKRIRRSVE